jgi:hypothetical protein
MPKNKELGGYQVLEKSEKTAILSARKMLHQPVVPHARRASVCSLILLAYTSKSIFKASSLRSGR